MGRVAVVAYDGVDELDLTGVLGPLRKAAAAGAAVRARLWADRPEVVTSGGLRVRADVVTRAGRPEPFDALVLPGGPGARTAEVTAVGGLAELVGRSRDRGVRTYAVCTGLLLAARAGHLGVSSVSFHHRKHALLRAAGYRGLIREGVIRQGSLTTVAGRGLPAVRPLLLGLIVLADTAGPDAAWQVAERMELDVPTLIPLVSAQLPEAEADV
ncbi:DJ-1/PfpI family protein [Streptomyces sp. NPDC006692]|uniref:DJ-1/PfpI family protein n=1 Tax=unclassified Streptomyces TaxID=2593676 RepID=UPI00369170D7